MPTSFFDKLASAGHVPGLEWLKCSVVPKMGTVNADKDLYFSIATLQLAPRSV